MTRTLDLFSHYLRSKNPLFIPDHPNGSASADDQTLDLFFHYLRSKNPLLIPDHPYGSSSIDDQNLGLVFHIQAHRFFKVWREGQEKKNYIC